MAPTTAAIMIHLNKRPRLRDPPDEEVDVDEEVEVDELLEFDVAFMTALIPKAPARPTMISK